MNLSKSAKLIPIIIGLTTNYSFAKTEMLFSESSIIEEYYLKSAKASIIAEQELNNTSLNFQKFKFEEYYKQWIDNTRFYSNPNMIIEDENFQNILNLKDIAVPMILHKIHKEPSQLIWALNIILNKKISKDETTSINEACKLWFKWGEKNNMI